MDGHYFVSYSRADAEDFAGTLADQLRAGDPSYRLWVDRRDIAPGQDWDEQVSDAIKSCAGLLFVMTTDSVRATSGCKNEWVWALKYKKPIIPLRLDSEAGLPYRLASREYVDFSDVGAGLARLRITLAETRSPTGVLRELRYSVADAERELDRVQDAAQRRRIEGDLDELRQRIAEQQRYVDNPGAAVSRTEERIAAGVEAERKPERTAPTVSRQARFVNQAPMTAPGYFQDRHVETELIGEFLRSPDERLITVVGRGGVGKTAMACRLLKAVEGGKLPDELGELLVDGIVYLSPRGHPVNFPNLFTDLCRLLDVGAADRLLQRYRDPQQTPGELMLALLEQFPTGRTVVLLDNMEDLIDSNTFQITEAALAQALETVLDSPEHGVKIIITTRVGPQQLQLTMPGRQRRCGLDEGLPSPYAERVLRARDPDGTLGIRDAPAELLDLARSRTRGFPRALEALAAILSADRNTTLPELLHQTAVLPENVVEALVGEAFERLDPLARQVMQALAIYPVPVPPVAVDYLLQPHLPAIDAAPVLGRLVNMQFARRDAGRYYLHQVDRDYALSRITVEQAGDREAVAPPFTRRALQDRAGDYFEQVRTPRQDWRTLDDLAPQLVEFDLRCQGEDFDAAAQVLFGIDFDYLIVWGHYRLTIDLHHRLQGHLTEGWTDAGSKTNLAMCLAMIGETVPAIDMYEEALRISRRIEDRHAEAVGLGGLGLCYADLGDIDEATRLHGQALAINRDLRNRLGEAADLGNLAGCHFRLGRLLLAESLFDQARAIYDQVDYPPGKGAVLGGLGLCRSDLGRFDEAIALHDRARKIAKDTGNRDGEAIALGNLALCYTRLGQVTMAMDLLGNALAITRETGNRQVEALMLASTGDGHAVLREFDKAVGCLGPAIELADTIAFAQGQSEARLCLARTLLFAGDRTAAGRVAAEAVAYPYPPTRPEIALVTGIATAEGGAADFQRALEAAEEQLRDTPGNFAARDLAALAHCGLAVSAATAGADHVAAAAASFRAARGVTSAAGVVETVLREFDALAAADTTGLLRDVRAVAAGAAATPA